MSLRLDIVLMWLFLAGSAWKAFGTAEFILAAAVVVVSLELAERERR